MTTKPNSSTYKIVPMPGFPFVKEAPRVVALVECGEDKFVNAGEMLAKANDKIKKAIFYGIQTWQGSPKINDKHHGWDASEHGGAYTECYVFKFNAGHVRVYGYLLRPKDDPKKIICCLVNYATKNAFKQDTVILDRLNVIGNKLKVMNAVEEYLKTVR